MLMLKRCNLFVFVMMLVLLPCSIGRTQNSATQGIKPYIVQGSTTFTHRVMEPYQSAIEASSGHKLTVLPSKSSRGLLALFERGADFAMISGPLEIEISDLKSHNPDLPFSRLQAFNILNTRMAFAVNRDNPVHQISDDEMRRILLGEITNWRDVGGRDLPIKIVMVREGGGVLASIESEFLHGNSVNVANPILVQVSSEVIKITEMLPGALGLSQLSIVTNSDALELKTEHPVEQRLNLVTLGDPTPEMRKVIAAARDVVGKADITGSVSE
jgi:phosphate transport system substrate-binding protein